MEKRYFNFEKYCESMGYDPEKVKKNPDKKWTLDCDGAEYEKGDWMHDKDGNAHRCSPRWTVAKNKRYFSAARWKEDNKVLKFVVPWLYEMGVKTFVQDCDGAEITDDNKMVGKSGAVYDVGNEEGVVNEKPTPEPAETLTVENLADLFKLFERIDPEKKEVPPKHSPAPAKYRIVIDCDGGDITNAEMIVNGKTVRKSSAKRNPADRFDFKTGAEYAFERLFKKEEKNTAFKLGDRIIVQGIKDEPTKWMNGKHGTLVAIRKNVPTNRKGGIDGHESVDVGDVRFDGIPNRAYHVYIERLKHE